MLGSIASSDALSYVQFLLSTRHGIRLDKITMDSGIPSDLGVDGDDALELINDIQEHYSIVLDLDYDNHFWPESGLVYSKTVIPLSVRDLVEKICNAKSRKNDE